MRKLILLGLMAATALPLASMPTAATAQTRRDVRGNREELREDRQALREDIRSGEARGEIRATAWKPAKVSGTLPVAAPRMSPRFAGGGTGR